MLHNMRTQFERDNYKYEPERIIYFNGNACRPWKVWIRRDDALGGFAWQFIGMRYYHPRTLKKDIQ
jgi:hypothetical protein